MYHFGERDRHVTAGDIEKIKAAHIRRASSIYTRRITGSIATSAPE